MVIKNDRYPKGCGRRKNLTIAWITLGNISPISAFAACHALETARRTARNSYPRYPPAIPASVPSHQNIGVKKKAATVNNTPPIKHACAIFLVSLFIIRSSFVFLLFKDKILINYNITHQGT